MTYNAKTAVQLRNSAGTITDKIAAEFKNIDTAIDALGAGTGALADGKVWIGSAAGAAAQKTPSGDITITREGVATVAPIKPLDLSGVVTADETTGTAIQVATSAAPLALDAAGQTGIKAFFSTVATSDTTYGNYTRLDVAGAGVEGISGRNKTLLTAASVGNAHGAHDTLELDTSAGNVTGLGTGHRGNVVVANRAIAAGTYFGAMAEIYALGNSSALPTSSNACLGINLQAGTAMDLVGNAISFSGTDGTGKMIYTATDSAPTMTGSIRIIVNGAKRYLHFSSAEAAGS